MCSVLLVEDDDDLAQVEASVLTDAGYKLTRAANGREALKCLETMQRPCVVLLDLMMPVLDGWQFLERADQDLLDKTAVVVTTAGQFDRPPRARELIRKPCDLDDLIKTVDTYCGPPQVAPQPPIGPETPGPWPLNNRP